MPPQRDAGRKRKQKSPTTTNITQNLLRLQMYEVQTDNYHFFLIRTRSGRGHYFMVWESKQPKFGRESTD